MAREDRQLVVKGRDLGVQARIHRVHARARQVESAAAPWEHRVAGERETLHAVFGGRDQHDRARRVPGCVQHSQLHASHRHDVVVHQRRQSVRLDADLLRRNRQLTRVDVRRQPQLDEVPQAKCLRPGSDMPGPPKVCPLWPM